MSCEGSLRTVGPAQDARNEEATDREAFNSDLGA